MRLPRFVAEDESRRRAGLVVGGLHRAAVKRGQAEKFKRVRRAKDAVQAFHSAADLIENVFAGIGDREIEHMIFLDVIEKFGRGIFGAAGGIDIVRVVNFDGHEAVGAGIRKRLDQNVFDDAENRRGCADAERERGDCDGGESGLFTQCAQSVGEIAPERFERRENANFARALFYVGDVAELAVCGVAGFRRVHTGRAVFVGALGEMEVEFVVEIAMERIRTRCGANALPDFAEPSVRHRLSFLSACVRTCSTPRFFSTLLRFRKSPRYPDRLQTRRRLRRLQNASDRARHAAPVFGFLHELLLAGCGQGIKLGAAIVVGNSPLRREQAA